MKTVIEVELTEAGVSNAGKERLKGEAVLPDGSKAFVTVYRAAPAAAPKEAKAVGPKVRKGAASGPVLTPAQQAMVDRAIAQVLAATSKPDGAPEAK